MSLLLDSGEADLDFVLSPGWSVQDTGQLQSTLTSAGNLAIQSGGDLSLTAVDLKAGGDAQLLATGDTLLGAALQIHQVSGKEGRRAVTTWDRLSVEQIVTRLDIGGSLFVNTGKADGRVVTAEQAGSLLSLGADITTGGESYLYGEGIDLLAVKGLQQSTMTKSKSRSFAGITFSSSSSTSASRVERLESSDLVAGDDVALLSRLDINLIAANIRGDDVALVAGLGGSGSLNILGDVEKAESYSAWEKSKFSFSPSGYLALGLPGSIGKSSAGGSSSTTTETYIGSTVDASGNLIITAADLLGITGSTLNAGGMLAGQAKAITVNAGMSSTTNARGGFSSFHSLVSGQNVNQTSVGHSTHATGSLLGGGSVLLNATGNLDVLGSQVVADRDVILRAGGNVTVGTVTETASQERHATATKNGVFGEGLSTTLGQQQQRLDQLARQTTEVGSLVGSSSGSVGVTAGGGYLQRASDVVAAEGISVTAQNILVEAGQATYYSEVHERQRQAGITAGVSSPVIDLARAADSDIERSEQVENERLKRVLQAKAGIEAAQAAKAAYDAGSAIAQAGDVAGGLVPDGSKVDSIGIKLSVSAGASSSRSDSLSSGSQAIASSLQSGGDITLRATGDGDAGSGDLGVVGSGISGANVTLAAADALTLQSATNTSTDRSSNKSSGGSVGLGFNLGTNGVGLSLDIAGQMAKGHANGDSLSHVEAVISASNQLTLSSGGDTTLKGAQASGEQIRATVGGDLNLESQQDRSTYDSRQTSTGLNLSIPLAGTTGSVGGNFARDKVQSDYLSVNEQTGLFAGGGGFDIAVAGNTDLKGAVIATEAPADKSQLTTGTLTFSDLNNHSDWEASATSFGLGLNTGPGLNPLNPTGINPSLPVQFEDQGHASGTTRAAIGAASIEVRQDAATGADSTTGLSRDTDHPNDGRVADGLDLGAVNEEIELARAQADIASAVAPYAFKVVGDISAKQGWAEGSPEKIALHGFTGALVVALGGGDALAGLSTAAANEWLLGQVDAYVRAQDPPLTDAQRRAITLGASAILGGVLDGAQGAALALNATQHNYLRHEEARALRAELEACKDRGCSGDAEQAIVLRYRAISEQHEKELTAACVDVQSQACIGHIQAAVEGMGLLPYSARGWNGLANQSGAVQQQAQRVRALLQLQAWQVQNCQGLSGAACGQKLAAADQAVKDQLRTSLDVLQMVPLAGDALGLVESVYTLASGLDLTGQDASRVMAMVNLLTVGVVKDAGTAGKVLNATDETRDAARESERVASAVSESGATNRTTFEAYKDELRAQMAKPHTTDPDLTDLMDDLYRNDAKIGSGSTAAAVRYENATGQPVGNVFHTQKAQDYSRALQKWLEVNPAALPSDRAAAENVLRDLQNALRGR